MMSEVDVTQIPSAVGAGIIGCCRDPRNFMDNPLLEPMFSQLYPEIPGTTAATGSNAPLSTFVCLQSYDDKERLQKAFVVVDVQRWFLNAMLSI